MGAVPFQEAKCALFGEAGDVADLDQQPGGARRADAGQVEQSGAGRGDQLGEFLVRGLLPLIDPLQVTDQLRRDPTSGLAGGITRSHLRQQGPGLPGGQVLLRTARDELQQELVQLGDHPGVVVAERATAVDQDPQDSELFVIDHRPQSGHPGADQGDRVRIGGVGLAALPGREHPGARGQPGWHIDDLLAVGEQPVGDVLADAGAALDGPDPIPPPSALAQHRGVAVTIGAEPATTVNGLLRGHYLDRCRAFVRVHPDHHTARDAIRSRHHQLLQCSIHYGPSSREGNAASSATNPSRASPGPNTTPGPRRPNESHTTNVGSRKESDKPGARTEPRQARTQKQYNKQPMSGRSWAPACEAGIVTSPRGTPVWGPSRL
jgi:hypothetical protein